jgi:hypothetical protein
MSECDHLRGLSRCSITSTKDSPIAKEGETLAVWYGEIRASSYSSGVFWTGYHFEYCPECGAKLDINELTPRYPADAEHCSFTDMSPTPAEG